ncbi:cobalamin trafficking protein CblD [Megachile rotundata]|uniref:cobalamin trafficking protein CblD n=1 Tax=Megachile rotundata TaxID=143995 RepID=UPI0006150DE2|nr:PREDICTED: methylmalonic aciduria and homocystinuria type D protein, mitochondrial [Megachile rotundata]XP_012151547.1 PREDICTED: methylmalonic aciduria and homocystinuria type D protein, mitochondrial [Megachile rotundata]
MFCLQHARKTNAIVLVNFFSKAHYSRRSDKNTNTYKVVRTNSENLDDVDGTVLGINSNWELLTPRGFRFYMPGSIGPGWSDVTTTAHVKTQLVSFPNDKINVDEESNETSCPSNRFRGNQQRPLLRCVAQDCPLLLRKGIGELFQGCLDIASAQLTVITISQAVNTKQMRWNRDLETEKLTKYFVLAASDICTKLQAMGYWADFINPFSGQPHLNLQKSSTLYKTDERFRCLGFKIFHRNNCKVILYDNNVRNFLGSLYTTAPSNAEFLEKILREFELENVNEAS